jgi:hypothetical protein
MAWMTTAEIKVLLGIPVGTITYDDQITLFNPIAQDRVECYILPTVYDEDESESIPLGYTPYYARLVWLMIGEGSTIIQAGNVKSQSFDGESVSFGDTKSSDNSKTSDEQLKKLKPLKKKYH